MQFYENVIEHNLFIIKFSISNILYNFYAECTVPEKIGKKCGKFIRTYLNISMNFLL